MRNFFLKSIGAAIFLILISVYSGCFAMSDGHGNEKAMTQSEYKRVLARQDEIHKFIRLATQYEKRADHQKALEFYLKAYEINQCAGLIAVCRGALADNYEALRKYDKALEHTNWFLEGLTPQEPLYV